MIMLYFDRKWLIFSTGLDLVETSRIISGASSEEQIESMLAAKGQKYLKRYRTLKQYTELTKKGEVKESIIPIITALPCVGKTTIAREVATRFGIGDVMGGDAIRASYRDLISKDEHPEFFCSIYGAWQYVGDRKETKENIILGFYKQAEIMNKLMERIVADRGIRDGESMVIEYLHFLPSQYDPEVLRHPSVIPIVLMLKSEEIHKKRISQRDFVTHLKGNSSRLFDALDKYRMMQDVQIKDAKKMGVPVVATDDYYEALDKVLDIIFERVENIIRIKSVDHDHIAAIKKAKEERTLNPEGKK